MTETATPVVAARTVIHSGLDNEPFNVMLDTLGYHL